MTDPAAATTGVRVISYAPIGPSVDPRAVGLSVESQAALRQFSEDRLVGYGVDRSDAAQLHERVLDGQPWLEAATQLAGICLASLEAAPTPGACTRVSSLRRASALLRMSQVMMLADTPQRQAIYTRAAERYRQAADLAGDRARVVLSTADGTVVGWRVPAAGPAVGAAIVIGGIEGYAMDFDCTGEALAARGIETLLLDGPGQGETRFAHHHYLTASWRHAFGAALDHLESVVPGRPIAIVGNSMGGSVAMAVAAGDPRVRACVDNGGIPAPWMVPSSIGTFFTKMVAYTGVEDAYDAIDVWTTVTPLVPGPNTDYALLVIHGGADPMVSEEMVRVVLAKAPAGERQMVVFSDGVHCIYNHKTDRDDLIADWVHERLAADAPDAAVA
jgi:alpha-beta hydrolase superfamily lysophospholipase